MLQKVVSTNWNLTPLPPAFTVARKQQWNHVPAMWMMLLLWLLLLQEQ